VEAALWTRLIGIMNLTRHKRLGCCGFGPVSFSPWLVGLRDYCDDAKMVLTDPS
jgi:hypothetical protein